MQKNSDTAHVRGAARMILCCGEALIDMIPPSTVSGKGTFVSHSGGSVFNTAIALGRLNVPVGMLTGLSDDLFGQQLQQDLEASHVDTTHIVHSARTTTLAFVQLSEGQASYSFYDENTAGRMLTPSDMPILSDNVGALYFGGISLACEPGAEAYATLLKNEGANRIVMIDPNIRPNFINDDARYRARLIRMIAGADIVKISEEDLAWLSDEPTSQSVKAKSLLKHGPNLVILTRGDDGASAYLNNGEEIEVAAQPVEAVDTVGAGDTFNAGVICKLSELGLLNKNGLARISSDEVKGALQFGAEVAAVTVSRAGANPPWADEI